MVEVLVGEDDARQVRDPHPGHRLRDRTLSLNSPTDDRPARFSYMLLSFASTLLNQSFK